MEQKKIYQAICSIMKDISCIKKEQKNQQQGFFFRSVDDVMNTLHPLLAKYNVFTVPEVLEQSREERTTSRGGNLVYSICRIKYTFFAEDGSYIEAITIGEGMDSGDKATNKAMAIAFKYAMFQVFCIPTIEMLDPDSETPPESKKQIPEQRKDFTQKVQRITIAEVEEINKELARTGISEVSILAATKAKFSREIKDLNELTIEQYNYVMNKFKCTPNKINIEKGE